MWSINTLGAASDPLGYWISKLSYDNTVSGEGVASDSAGNIYACGYANTADGFGLTDGLLVKYNFLGGVVWHKYLGGASGDQFNAVTVDFLDNIYVAGQSTSLGDTNSSGILVKYDTDGNLLWQRAFGLVSGGGGLNYFFYGVDTDSSGNVYVTGEGLDSGGLQRGTVVKYDSSGAVLWQTTTDDGAFSYRSIATTAAGDSYVTGTVITGVEGGQDFSVIKLDAAGAITWQKNIGSSANDNAEGLAIDSSGNVYVAGRTNIGGSLSASLVKLNSSGVIQWQIELADAAGSEFFAKVAVDSSDDVYLVGNTDQGGTNSNGFAVKYSSSGTLQWQRSLGGVNFENLTDIEIDSSGNLYFIGDSFFDREFLLTKLGTDGNLVGTFKVGDFVVVYQPSTLTSLTNTLAISDSAYNAESSPGGTGTTTLSEEARTLSETILYF